VEDRSDCDAEARITIIAVMALFGGQGCCILGLAVWASRLPSPSDLLKMGDTISFGGEQFVDLNDVHGHYLLLGHKLTQAVVACQVFLLP